MQSFQKSKTIFLMQQGAKAFIRMQQTIEQQSATRFRLDRRQDHFPLNLFTAAAAQKQHSKSSAAFLSKQFVGAIPNINAVALPGVFFGRLIRRLGSMPSRRISGPSAAFISVNRLDAQSSVHRFAPMNNPYRLQQRCHDRLMEADGFQP